jgi:hypothetical protein
MFFLFAFCLPVFAQEFIPAEVIFPITDFKPDIKLLPLLSVKFGTGFCLDPGCRFVGTNYHVAKLMGRYIRIKGVFSVHRYLDSDPEDAGAENIDLPMMGSMKFTLAHDLAIYEMRHPLKHRHGIDFDADNLDKNTEVDICGFPFNWNPKRKLVCWHGKFLGMNPQGLLALGYEEGRVHGGASGGIVVASKTKKIVGILNSMGEGKDRVAFAVPVKELADFVARAQPYLQAILFPKTVFVSPVAADLYPPYVWPPTKESSPLPVEVAKLRETAQHLADSMLNFIAIQTLAWGYDNREPEWTDAYEIQIVDGSEHWRRPGSRKFYDNIPFPPIDGWLRPGGDWSWLPSMIGSELSLQIHQGPDALVNGRTIHVFQYFGHAENEVCPFRHFLFFVPGPIRFYDCHGEVWTDETGIILRVSEAIDLLGSSWHNYRGVMTYGWLEKDGTQRLVPVTFAAQIERKNKMYWCRGLFTDYQMFGVKSRWKVAAQ